MNTDPREMVQVIEFWKASLRRKPLFSRSILATINTSMREVVALIGPRRSGKSSLFTLLIEQEGVRDTSLFLNFEDPYFIEHATPAIIEEYIAVFKEYFNKKLTHIFLDEIQAIDGWERAVRKLRDGTSYKVYITGSSSKMLSKEIGTVLTGRHRSYRVLPLSFEEYLHFNGVTLTSARERMLHEKKLHRLFQKYSSIGGFPEVVMTGNRELLKDYFYDVIYKDIVARYGVRDTDALEKIALFLLSNAAKIISVTSIKNTYALSHEVARDYIEYLKESFLVFDVPQYSHSLKVQHKALKKYYSIDIGLSNAVSFRISQDKGRILENIVALELLRRNTAFWYYKTKDGKEVDFYVPDKKTRAKSQLIQVTASLSQKETRQREVDALLAAMEERGVYKGLILTDHEHEDISIGKYAIQVKPVFEWLLG